MESVMKSICHTKVITTRVVSDDATAMTSMFIYAKMMATAIVLFGMLVTFYWITYLYPDLDDDGATSAEGQTMQTIVFAIASLLLLLTIIVMCVQQLNSFTKRQPKQIMFVFYVGLSDLSGLVAVWYLSVAWQLRFMTCILVGVGFLLTWLAIMYFAYGSAMAKRDLRQLPLTTNSKTSCKVFVENPKPTDGTTDADVRA